MNSNPSRRHAWLGAIVIFLLGLTMGVAGTVFVGVRAVRRNLRVTPGVTFADRATARIARDLTAELQLTPDEGARVRADPAQAAGKLRVVRLRAMQDVHRELRAAMVRIGQDLPAEKRERYREIIRRRFTRAGLDDREQPESSTTNPH